MLVNVDKNAVNTNTEMARQFTINMSAEAFEALSGGIYTDVIKSMVRELISNANDGHVKKDNVDVPFEVTCPTEASAYFQVRDFGIGMDDKTITEVYTQYFNSTKTSSNQEVGGFGLGAKIPIAYTDQYSVVSYLNGKMKIYQVCKQNGVPTMYTVDELDTDEPDGILVKVPVEKGDIKEFSKAIGYYKTLSGFNFNTNVSENDIFQVNYIEQQNLNEEDYKLIENRELIIRIGGVPYQVELDDFLNKFDAGYYTRFDETIKDSKVPYNKIWKNALSKYDSNFIAWFKQNGPRYWDSLDMNIIVDFPIGSLEVTRSRETIQINAKNCETLVSKLLDVNMKVIKKIYDCFGDFNFKREEIQQWLKNYYWVGAFLNSYSIPIKIEGFKTEIEFCSNRPSVNILQGTSSCLTFPEGLEFFMVTCARSRNKLSKMTFLTLHPDSLHIILSNGSNEQILDRAEEDDIVCKVPMKTDLEEKKAVIEEMFRGFDINLELLPYVRQSRATGKCELGKYTRLAREYIEQFMEAAKESTGGKLLYVNDNSVAELLDKQLPKPYLYQFRRGIQYLHGSVQNKLWSQPEVCEMDKELFEQFFSKEYRYDLVKRMVVNSLSSEMRHLIDLTEEEPQLNYVAYVSSLKDTNTVTQSYKLTDWLGFRDYNNSNIYHKLVENECKRLIKAPNCWEIIAKLSIEHSSYNNDLCREFVKMMKKNTQS